MNSAILGVSISLMLQLVALGDCQSRFPPRYSPDRVYLGQKLGDLPALPEKQVDIGLWALIIAKECDSSIDIGWYLQVLDSMAMKIRYMVGPRDGDMLQFMMVKT